MARAHRWERPSPDLRSKESWQRVSPTNQLLSPAAQQLDRITVLFDERYHSGLIAKAAWTTVYFINTPTFVPISLRRLRSPENRRQPCLPACRTDPSVTGSDVVAWPAHPGNHQWTLRLLLGNLVSRPNSLAMTATAEGVSRLAASPDFVRNAFSTARE